MVFKGKGVPWPRLFVPGPRALGGFALFPFLGARRADYQKVVQTV